MPSVKMADEVDFADMVNRLCLSWYDRVLSTRLEYFLGTHCFKALLVFLASTKFCPSPSPLACPMVDKVLAAVAALSFDRQTSQLVRCEDGE
jgi:hypothetical protein